MADVKWSEPLPPPVLIDGFWHVKEGAIIEGVVTGIGETQYGSYLAVRIVEPVEISRDGEYVTVNAGSVVGISEYAAIRPLYALHKSGPIAVRVVVKGKIGKAWDMEVRHRPAF